MKSVGSLYDSLRMAELHEEQDKQMKILQLLLAEWDEKLNNEMHGPDNKKAEEDEKHGNKNHGPDEKLEEWVEKYDNNTCGPDENCLRARNREIASDIVSLDSKNEEDGKDKNGTSVSTSVIWTVYEGAYHHSLFSVAKKQSDPEASSDMIYELGRCV